VSGSPEVRARNHGRRKSGCDPLVHLRMPSQANAANAQLERLTARTVPSYRSFSIWERFRLASIVSPPLSSQQSSESTSHFVSKLRRCPKCPRPFAGRKAARAVW